MRRKEMIVKFLIAFLKVITFLRTKTSRICRTSHFTSLSFLVLFNKSSNHLKLPYVTYIICTVVRYTIRLNIKPLSVPNLQYLYYTTKQKIDQSKGITINQYLA